MMKQIKEKMTPEDYKSKKVMSLDKKLQKEQSKEKSVQAFL